MPFLQGVDVPREAPQEGSGWVKLGTALEG